MMLSSTRRLAKGQTRRYVSLRAPCFSRFSTSAPRFVTVTDATHRAVNVGKNGGDFSSSPLRFWKSDEAKSSADQDARTTEGTNGDPESDDLPSWVTENINRGDVTLQKDVMKKWEKKSPCSYQYALKKIGGTTVSSCTLTTLVDNQEITVSADGISNKDARKLAVLRLIPKLRASSVDESLYVPSRYRIASKRQKDSAPEGKSSVKSSVKSTTAARPTPLDLSVAGHQLMEEVSSDLAVGTLQSPEEPAGLRHRPRKWSNLDQIMKSRHSDELRQAYARYEQDTPRAIVKGRAGLPVAAYKHNLLELVDNNVYSILIGATGSGKTTQVPQLIFEEWCRRGRGAECNIICTQPRVIAATSVASRVADELGRTLRSRVGFHVRDNAKVANPRDGSITFCTTGILLQQIQNDPDFIFDNVSHLLLDEVHERDMVLDFTLTVLKRAVSDRLKRKLKVPRILLMSATLDEEAFAKHFQNMDENGLLTNAPSLSVPGRTFPVEEKYLEEVLEQINRAHHPRHLEGLRNDKVYVSNMKRVNKELEELSASATPTADSQPSSIEDKEESALTSDIDWDKLDEEMTPVGLIVETIAHVLRTTTDGAVLVFLPGFNEIRKVEDMLRYYRPLGVDIDDDSRYRLFQLHSNIPDSQRRVFESVPQGVRKVILSSPVAETSVTIPDVTCVIDSGHVRETQYDTSARASWLRNSWITRSSAKQRAGRAGRVQSGTYLAMYSKARLESMAPASVPEMMRADLQSTCLAVKSKFKDADVPEFLASALDPPPANSVTNALQCLVDTGALTPGHDLTSLGHLLSKLPIHPSLGKMIVMGIIFRCLDPIVVAGAAFEAQELWIVRSHNTQEVWESKARFARGSGSDLIATYNAYRYIDERFSAMGKDAIMPLAQEHLHWGQYQRLKESVKFVRKTLQESGLVPATLEDPSEQRIGGRAFNTNSRKQHIVNAVLVAGLQSNIAGRRKEGKKFHLGDRPGARIATSSMFASKSMNIPDDKLLAFGELIAAQDGYAMRKVNVISPILAALFSSSLTTDAHARKVPTFVANKFLPLPVSVLEEYGTAATTPKKTAWETVRHFRKTLDRVLDTAFEYMARAQRGAFVPQSSANIVETFLERVVKVLDAEAAAEPQRASLLQARKDAEIGAEHQKEAEKKALKAKRKAEMQAAIDKKQAKKEAEEQADSPSKTRKAVIAATSIMTKQAKAPAKKAGKKGSTEEEKITDHEKAVRLLEMLHRSNSAGRGTPAAKARVKAAPSKQDRKAQLKAATRQKVQVPNSLWD